MPQHRARHRFTVTVRSSVQVQDIRSQLDHATARIGTQVERLGFASQTTVPQTQVQLQAMVSTYLHDFHGDALTMLLALDHWLDTGNTS